MVDYCNWCGVEIIDGDLCKKCDPINGSEEHICYITGGEEE